jgi:broad specificity phosphatase PhoE
VTDRKEWHGTLDPPLSLKGREHALTAAERLRQLNLKVVAIICSDFSRAVETATVFGHTFNCDVSRNPLLRERHLGEWEGLTQAEIERRWPGLIEAWRLGSIDGPPGGETDGQVTRRVCQALGQCANVDLEDATLIISHAGLLRGLLATSGLPDEDIPPLGGRWLTMKHDTGQIRLDQPASL